MAFSWRMFSRAPRTSRRPMVRPNKAAVGLAVSAVTAITIATGIIKPWEGRSLTPYRDIVGVVTWCYGETRGVPKDSYTPGECDDMLAKGVLEFDANLRALCLAYPMPDGVRAAVISLAYNVGVAGVCKGSIPALAAAGDLRGICNALPRYNRAGGRVVRGLTNRRAAEQRVCLEAIP